MRFEREIEKKREKDSRQSPLEINCLTDSTKMIDRKVKREREREKEIALHLLYMSYKGFAG